MKLRIITGIAIVLFLVVVSFFLIKGDALTHSAPANTKPSVSQIKAEEKAAKEGLFDPSGPAIIH
jgi:hypothetical protein